MLRLGPLVAAVAFAALALVAVAERAQGQRLGGIALPSTSAAAADAPRLIDVPFVAQERLLCGAAVVEMALRHAGAGGIYARDFRALVREDEGGIRTDELAAAVSALGWEVRAGASDRGALEADVGEGRPAAVLLAERPGRYHYVLVVGVTRDSVIVHDPGRRPDVGIATQEFDRRWEGAGRWSLVVLSGPTPVPEEVPAPSAEGASLTARRDPPEPPPHPQLERASGLFRASRWKEAAEAALDAAEADPTDPRAWALLGTSRYLAGDARGALRAWNHDRSPTLDRIVISGLRRTRHPVVQELSGLRPGEPLEAGAFDRARRRLALLPAVSSSSLTYRALPGRAAVAEATVTEHAFPPRGISTFATSLLPALVQSELRARVVGPTGGGEAATMLVRWAEARPGVALTVGAPLGGPVPGVVEVRAAWEKERYALPAGASRAMETRAGVRLGLTDWATGWLRWRIEGGLDRWQDDRNVATGRAELELSPPGSRTSLIGSVEGGGGAADALRYVRWSVRGSASPLGHDAAWRLSVEGLAAGAGEAAPLMLRPGAGVGRAREGLLRAHPLERDGALSTLTIGSGLLNGTLELERRVARLPFARLGVAAFIDAARISNPGDLDSPEGARALIDSGFGVRVEVPAGRLRLDAALGGDGSRALSIGWEARSSARDD